MGQKKDRTSWGDTEVAPWPALGFQPKDTTAREAFPERRREGQILPPLPLALAHLGHQRKSPTPSAERWEEPSREEGRPVQRPFSKTAGFKGPVEEGGELEPRNPNPGRGGTGRCGLCLQGHPWDTNAPGWHRPPHRREILIWGFQQADCHQTVQALAAGDRLLEQLPPRPLSLCLPSRLFPSIQC